MTTLQDKTGENVVVQYSADNSAYLIAYEKDMQLLGSSHYLDNGDERIFYHTETNPNFQGRGLASILVKLALQHTTASNLKIVASCPMVLGWLQKHPEFEGEWRQPTMEDIMYLRQNLS